MRAAGFDSIVLTSNDIGHVVTIGPSACLGVSPTQCLESVHEVTSSPRQVLEAEKADSVGELYKPGSEQSSTVHEVSSLRKDLMCPGFTQKQQRHNFEKIRRWTTSIMRVTRVDQRPEGTSSPSL